MRPSMGRCSRGHGDVPSSHPHTPLLAGGRRHVRGTAGRVDRAAADRSGQAGRLRRALPSPAGRAHGGRRPVAAADRLERGARLATVPWTPGLRRACQRHVATRGLRVQVPVRRRGLAGAGPVGGLPAVVGADRRARNQAPVRPAGPARPSRAGVRPEGRPGRPGAQPGAGRPAPRADQVRLGAVIRPACARAASNATGGADGTARRGAGGGRSPGLPPRSSPGP